MWLRRYGCKDSKEAKILISQVQVAVNQVQSEEVEAEEDLDLVQLEEEEVEAEVDLEDKMRDNSNGVRCHNSRKETCLTSFGKFTRSWNSQKIYRAQWSQMPM